MRLVYLFLGGSQGYLNTQTSAMVNKSTLRIYIDGNYKAANEVKTKRLLAYFFGFTSGSFI
ncbi:MAG: hypothetical protein DRG30_06190 [Epsilonproteobacteria bacterium]|nr:MAG: hypothetical protein DRG30_06190 [Campylobacterota bacterium]